MSADPSPAALPDFLLRHRRTVLVLAGLLALALLPGLVLLDTDNSPAVYFVRGSPGVETYRSFVETFGGDATLRVLVDGPSVFTGEGLSWLGEFERRLSAMDGVERVSGLASHYRRQGWPPPDAEAFRRRALDNDLDRSAGWITADGSAATVLLQLSRDLGPDETELVLDRVRSAASAASGNDEIEPPPAGLRVRVLGLPVLNRALDRSSREIQERYLPLLVLFTVVLLLVFLRRVADLLAPLLFVGFCQLLALGPMGWAGADLNLVLAVLPPLVFVIALATALHVMLRARRLPGDLREQVIAVYGEKRWAVFWTGITTAVGFLSLAVSRVTPVRSLGLWAAAGLLATTAAAFLVLPVLLADGDDEGDEGDEEESGDGETTSSGGGDRFVRNVGRHGRAWAEWAIRRRAWVLGLALLLGVGAIAGLPAIEVESNALNYLPPEHPLRAGIEELEARGVGVAALEIWVRREATGGGAPPPFVSAIEVERLADLGKELESNEAIFGVLSAGDVLRDAMRLVPTTPGSGLVRPQMVLDALGRDEQGREVLSALLTEDRHSARLTAFVETAGAEEITALRETVRRRVEARFPDADEIVITGEYPLLLEAQGHLLETLLFSFTLTLLAIALVLRLALPSTRLALLALLPNLWPVAGVLGAMGWLGVPLDIATVMVASVILGLAVDDTLHTLGHFRRLAPEHGAEEAMERTLEATAPAYVLTGCILIAGFGVCALSDFAPLARFGALSALGIALAVLGDLLLLPALFGLTPRDVVERLGSKAQGG